ncbi:hypothetical protein ACS0TY_014074 [Phlomoides rotata]
MSAEKAINGDVVEMQKANSSSMCKCIPYKRSIEDPFGSIYPTCVWKISEGDHDKILDIRATSLMVIVNSNDSNMGESVGYSLWHRKADCADYPAHPTHTLLKPNTKFMLSGLLSAAVSPILPPAPTPH